jgi:SAM-dependent methyltransferase
MKRTNLFETYQNTITGNESVLDVGCGGLEDLVCFEDGPFKVLHGVDRDLDWDYRFQTYSNSRKVINNKKPLSQTEFEKRYTLRKADVKDYDFDLNHYNFIICRNLIHFFPDPEKFILIERMHEALAESGLLYLQLYHTTSKQVIENKDYIHFGMNIYRSKKSTDKYYLMDKRLLIEEVKKKYDILNNEVEGDEDRLIFVIKK